jgi:hypothetical protein
MPSQGSVASPLVSIGDNADIFFNGSSTLQWTSNVFRDEDDEVSDLMWIFSPGFDLNIGRGLSNADLSVITSYDIIRYQDEDELNTELFHIKALGSYKASRLDLSGSVGFDESKTSTGDTNLNNIQDLIEFDEFSADLNAEYRFSPKFSFGAGLEFTDKEYQSYNDPADAVKFADRERTRFPFDLFYELTPKVDLSVGYTYTEDDVGESYRGAGLFNANPNPLGPIIFANQIFSGDYQRDSHFFNVGARGNILPKLSGFFKVGYRTRSTEDSLRSAALNGILVGPPPTTVSPDDSGMLGLDADLRWAATPKLTAILALSRDFGIGGEGQSTENTSFDLQTSYSISSRFAASGNLGYTLRDYTRADREDNQYRAGLRLSYAPNRYWKLSSGYTYSENDSNTANRSYTNHTLDFSASLRY